MELSKRISQLFANTGSKHIVDRLLNGISNPDPLVCAAYIDFIAHLDSDIVLNEEFTDAFHKAFSRDEPVVRCACAEAVQARPEFRTPESTSQLRKGLRRGFIEKHACLRTLELVQGSMSTLWPDVVTLLGHRSPLISGTAARCILSSGIFASKSLEDKQVLDRAIRVWQQANQPRIGTRTSVMVDKDNIKSLIRSLDEKKMEQGIRYLALVENDGRFVHSQIMSVLSDSTDHRQKVTCLQALRNSDDALDLVTLSDADYVCSLLANNERDVRIEAARVLGVFPSDEQVIAALFDHYILCSENNHSAEEASEMCERFPVTQKAKLN